MTADQIKRRIATINDSINDMVDANLQWDIEEVRNFDWDHFQAQLEIHISMLEHLIGIDASMVFIQSLIESSGETQEEYEFDEYSEYVA